MADVDLDVNGTADPSDDDSFVTEEVWEELSDDNGEIIEFKTGMEQQGFFVHTVTVELPEPQHKVLKDGTIQTTADLYVFAENVEAIETRWAAWSNYSLKKITFTEGDYYSLRCLGSRKTAEGEMKIFSVRHRTTVRLPKF